MRLLPIAMAAITGWLFSPQLQAQPHDWQEAPAMETAYIIDRARLYHDEGNFHLAAETYRQALRLDPASTTAWYNLALAYCHLDEVYEAGNCLDTLFSITPDDSKALPLYGLILYRQNKFDRAVTAFNFAIADMPSNSLYAARGLAYLAGGHLEQASADFETVLQADPGNVRACMGKGAVLLQMADFRHAMGYFSRILDLDPENAEALTNRGICHCQQGAQGQAMQDFSLAASVAELPATWLAKARCHLLYGDFDAAMTAAKAGLRIAPMNPNVYTAIGEIELAMGKSKAASESFAVAIDLAPNEAGPYLGRGQAAAMEARFDEAVYDVYVAMQHGLPEEEGREALLGIYKKMDANRWR